MSIAASYRLIWLPPFFGPAVTATTFFVGKILHIQFAEQLNMFIFVAAILLNVLFAVPALLVLRYFKQRSLLLFASAGAAAVAFPAFLLSTPLFSFEPLPELGFHVVPLLLFISLGALTGVFFSRRHGGKTTRADAKRSTSRLAMGRH